MRGIELIEPTELYNLLNQLHQSVPCVVNEYYLVLFDPRKPDDFHESHVVTSKHIKRKDDKYIVPTNIDYSAVNNLVVIDSRCSSLKDIQSPAVGLAELLWKMGSKYPVKVVKGGYEEFSALYPFLRTQKMLWTQGEIEALFTYPIEVLPGFLYIGLRKQAGEPKIEKDLKIKAHVNLTSTEDPVFKLEDRIHGKSRDLISQLLNVPVEDSIHADLFSQFSTCCSFIQQHHKGDGKTLLVYSELGISRCVTVALSYLIFHHKIPLKDALRQIKKCHHSVCPNQTFIKDLLKWELDVLGSQITVPSDLGFLSYV